MDRAPYSPGPSATPEPANDCIVVSFARPEESRFFLATLKNPQPIRFDNFRGVEGTLETIHVTVVHTGIGPEAARKAAELVLQKRNPSLWIGAGFAGALDPNLALADIVLFEPFEEAAASEKTATPPAKRIVSRSIPVETAGEKAALFRETNAAAVDMETDTLAALVHSANIPFLAIRAISDRAAQPLPVPFSAWFDLSRQKPRPLALIAFLLRHPSAISPFARFVKQLPEVSKSLALAVQGAVIATADH